MTKAKTCTEAGVKTFTCLRDGSHTRTESIAARGHDWRTTTTEPDGFNDGQIVAACSRCGESSVETIPAVPTLFNKLRNLTPSIAEMGDMVVTLQPTGGQIPAYGSHTLTNAVEGGVAPYHYTLYRGNKVVDSTDEDAKAVGIRVDAPGVYHYVVEDARKETAESNTVKIAGDGKPVITRQPGNVVVPYQDDGKYNIPLSCEAISMTTGDGSNLLYEWETYLINAARWECFYWGRSFITQPMREQDFKNFNTFRCKVTDKTTGEYTYTDVVTASIELSITIHNKVTEDFYKTELTYSIHGGTLPYHVFFESYKKYYDVTTKEIDMFAHEEGHRWFEYMPSYNTVSITGFYYYYIYDNSGQMHEQGTRADCGITVVDSSGQIATEVTSGYTATTPEWKGKRGE